MVKKINKVFVVADKAEALAELCGGGRQLGTQVVAFISGPLKDNDRALSCGADIIYRLTELADYSLNQCFETILGLIRKDRPNLVLIQAGKKGRLVAGRLAAECRTSVLADIVDLVAGETLLSKRLVYGGAAVKTEYPTSSIAIATIGRGMFQPQAADSLPQSSVIDVDMVPPAHSSLRCLEIKRKESTSVDLSAAKRIVGVGRGFAKKEDLALAEALAASIGAEIGCTRPVAEGENWLPRESYIGVSGAMLRPDLYIAIGISGQVQHMIGINQSKTIIAINKDKAAPIFKQADYGIVGDLYDVVPALINRIKTGQGG